MSTVVLYYSYTGYTKKLAEAIAAKENASLFEIQDLKRPGTLKAYSAGSLAAHRQRPWPIAPLKTNLEAYDSIIILGPIWFGYPAPQLNSVFALLPPGKSVSLIMTSGSGHSQNKEAVCALVKKQGCAVSDYTDHKAAP